MKKLLILIVVAALYFHFYPNEKLNTWLSEQKEMILSTFSDATDTKVRLKPERIFEELSTKFNQFKPEEQSYVSEITRSRQSIRTFYNKYCKSNQSNVRFHRENLAIVCEEINNFSHLL